MLKYDNIFEENTERSAYCSGVNKPPDHPGGIALI